MTLFKEVADIKTSDQLHLPVPEAVYHNVVAQPTEIQQAMVQELSERAARVHAGAVDASVDNMLRITTDGRKLGLDQRIINPDLPDDPSSKVNMCVDNIYRIWDEGQADKLTQLVFCDLSTPKTGAPAAKAAKAVGGNLDNPELHAVAGAVKDDPPEPEFTVYDDIREKLVARGIPREQIAFIHEANTEARKKELFAKVRSGQVRVLMGSTFKMGAGMNVQDRLVALHDLDAPWRPGDLEQRSGRIIRQGNRNKQVGLNANAIQEISGGMSDAEQQRIVEDFGRTESPVRVLVASDVASEGLNLHYLSHRLIHFDIPWSLMVFQQRNGRIDRYGQQKRPDIRYMLIESDNKRIKGDMRIIEILITKEEQALKNIGDPSLLLGKFTIEDEELVVAEAIEDGSNADAFEQTLDAGEDDFDPFEALMAAAGEAEAEEEKKSEIVTDETLFSDLEYLYQALMYLNQTESHPVERLQTVSGLDIKMTPDMERRLRAVVPEEALPQGETLRVSDDKAFCMEQMRNSMQKNMDESAWPTTQYLWKLHPIMSWVNDKASLLFKRNEAPVIGIPGKLISGEIIYIVTGSIPNLKSTPLVDEWFGLLYQNGKFVKVLSMNEVVQKAGLSNSKIPNTNCITESEIADAGALMQDVVAHAKAYLDEHYKRYQTEMSPLLDEEVDKLIALQERHKEYYQMTLFEHERKLQEQERRVDELFDQFMNWVKETLTIQNNPYIRVVSVLMGVSQ